MAQTHSLDLELSSSQYASIADASQTGLDITSDMTIECWVKFESIPDVTNDLAIFAGKEDAATAADRAYYFAQDYNGGTQRLLMLQGTAGGNSFVGSDTFTPATGIWYHLAVTWQQSSGDTKFYVNGRQHGATKTGTTSALRNSSEAFIVGARDNGGTKISFLDGLIKDLRIFNDVRTSTEIATDAHTQTVSDANLQGEWNFNNDYLDNTANNNDLTASGSPTFSTDRPWVDATQVSGSTYLETNLVSYWTLDESSDGSGAVTRLDSTASNNDLTDNNTTPSAAGKINNGADLELANNEYLSISDASQTGLDLSTAFGVSAWVNLESDPGSNEDRPVLTKISQPNNESYYVSYRNHGGTPQLRMGVDSTGNGTSADYLSVNQTLTLSTWYHVVWTWRGSDKRATFYLNGVQVGTDQIGTAVASIYNGGADFQIGAFTGLGSLKWDGILDEIALYSRYLHYGDVLDLYNAGTGITYSPPLTPSVNDQINLTESNTIAVAPPDFIVGNSNSDFGRVRGVRIFP